MHRRLLLHFFLFVFVDYCASMDDLEQKRTFRQRFWEFLHAHSALASGIVLLAILFMIGAALILISFLGMAPKNVKKHFC